MPREDDLPSTLKRSDQHAQDIFLETLASARNEYGPGDRASRTAYAALKHSYEKIGDHWEPKSHKGPSDPRSEQTFHEARTHPAPSYGGVDIEGHTKEELLERAKNLGIPGTSAMNKSELAEAINRANQRATAASRQQTRQQNG